MDVPLFGLTPQELQQAAADPWKWWTFHHEAVPALKKVTPVVVASLLGMAAAFALRRRCPPAARRVFLGCATLLLAHLYAGFGFWLWAVIDPDPTVPVYPVRRPPLIWAVMVLWMLAEAAGVSLLAWAVVCGRQRRAEGGP